MTMPFLGFASGLPLALTSGTLQAWLTVAGLDIQAIGFFSLIGVPYTLKFLWSPAMDRYTPDFLGRRRGWLISTQVVLLIAIGFLSRLNPLEHIGLLAFAALSIAFLSASQDIAFDAYRADVLRARERGLGVALSVIGYRIGMLVSGALALIMADRMGWSMTYLAMAALILIGVVATLWSEEPERPADAPARMLDAIAKPLRQFFSRTNALVLLVLLVLYKLGDAFAGSLTTAFLIGGMKFTLSDVGIINKGLGLGCSLLGVALGGVLMIRWGMYRSLVAFAVFQGVSNLGFWALAWLGKNYALLALVIALENLSGGMGTA
ncbi:MAG: AmpG family muropeptide MFS transporter, partial [Gammaproteobacteria bacterium]